MSHLRTRIFVDFWNLQLHLNEHRPDYRLDWKKLSPLLITEAGAILGVPLQFEETNVYLSYDPNTEKDRNLHRWSFNVLDRFPGIRVIVKERKAKRAPACPSCHQLVDICPHCGGRMIGTIEKGIDTAIVTDMISLAWADAWEVAILVSSDRDFIPAVEFLANKGRRVINAHFPPKGMHLARTCWASIDLRPHLDNLAR
jgi:uncharacterized LabA/DUF88 family protein